MTRLRIRRAMYGGANPRRQQALNALSDLTATNVKVVKHDLSTGTYVIELPTTETITLPKTAIAGFLTGFYAAASIHRTLDALGVDVTSIADALPDLIEIDD